MSAAEEQSIAVEGSRAGQVSAEEQSRMREQQSRVGERSRGQQRQQSAWTRFFFFFFVSLQKRSGLV